MLSRLNNDSGSTTFRSICTSPPGCHGGCGVLLECSGGRLTGVRGDPANPFNRGVLCPRGLAIRSSLYSPDRITTPMLREGRRGSGRWRAISWEKALDMAADMLCEARDASGPESVAFCKGTGRDIGPYLSALAFGFGSPNYFAFGPGTGSACLMPRMAASRAVMGGFPVADCSQYFPQRYSDPRWRLPGCMIVWGGNPIWSNPDGFLGQWIADCIRRGTRLIVVDPRRTWLASRAAVHLQIKPGTDGALALAMLGSIISGGLMDREFVAGWTTGIDALEGRTREWDVRRAAAECGVPPEDIEAAAELYSSSRPASIHWGVSIDMSRSAMGTAHSILSLMAVTGNVDRPGGNILASDPFGIARRGGSPPPARALGQDRWPLLRLASPYAHADALLKALERPGAPAVKAAWIQGTNTFVSSFADPSRAGSLLGRIPSVIVVDPFMSPTASKIGDLLMPPAMYPERNGIRNWWYMLAAVNRAVDPPGGMLSDMEIVLETGRRVCPGSFPWERVEDWFDAILEPSGMDFEALRTRGPVMPGISYGRFEDGGLRGDGQAGFDTPSGRIEMDSDVLREHGADPLPSYSPPPADPEGGRYPFLLTTGARVPFFFHSEHRNVPAMRERNPHPLAEMHPAPAARLGLEEGDRVSVASPWGECERVLRLDDSLRPDTVSVQHGWWLPEATGAGGSGAYPPGINVNALFPEGLQPADGMGYPFRSLFCRIERLGGRDHASGSGRPSTGASGKPPGCMSVDPSLCCGCRACEVACVISHGREKGIFGIAVGRTGPGSYAPGWTSSCDSCAGRDTGPFCALNCPTGCLVPAGDA